MNHNGMYQKLAAISDDDAVARIQAEMVKTDAEVKQGLRKPLPPIENWDAWDIVGYHEGQK
jgi:hypothetical protein